MTILEILYLILGGFVILAVVLVYNIFTLRKTIKENLSISDKLEQELTATIEEQIERIKAKETRSYNLGMSSLRGQWLELLGDFESIRHYDQLAVLSSATKQFSLDLLGIVEKDDKDKADDAPAAKDDKKDDKKDTKKSKAKTTRKASNDSKKAKEESVEKKDYEVVNEAPKEKKKGWWSK